MRKNNEVKATLVAPQPRLHPNVIEETITDDALQSGRPPYRAETWPEEGPQDAQTMAERRNTGLEVVSGFSASESRQSEASGLEEQETSETLATDEDRRLRLAGYTEEVTLTCGEISGTGPIRLSLTIDHSLMSVLREGRDTTSFQVPPLVLRRLKSLVASAEAGQNIKIVTLLLHALHQTYPELFYDLQLK